MLSDDGVNERVDEDLQTSQGVVVLTPLSVQLGGGVGVSPEDVVAGGRGVAQRALCHQSLTRVVCQVGEGRTGGPAGCWVVSSTTAACGPEEVSGPVEEVAFCRSFEHTCSDVPAGRQHQDNLQHPHDCLSCR